jgi:hypothetical protein
VNLRLYLQSLLRHPRQIVVSAALHADYTLLRYCLIRVLPRYMSSQMAESV